MLDIMLNRPPIVLLFLFLWGSKQSDAFGPSLKHNKLIKKVSAGSGSTDSETLLLPSPKNETISSPTRMYATARGNDSKIRIVKPALVPLSWPETLNGLFNERVGNFLVKSASLANSSVFRIPLPIPWTDTVVVGNADLAQKILTDRSTTKSAYFYAAYKKITGKPTTFSLGDTSSRYQVMHASILAPCMSSTEVERMRRIMDRRASEWIDKKLAPLAKTMEPFDIVDVCSQFIFDTYMESSFEYKTKPEDYAVLKASITYSMPFYLMKRRKNPLRKLANGLMSSSARTAKKSLRELRAYCQLVLDSYRHSSSLSSQSSSKAKTFIRAIADPDGPFTNDEERVAEIIDLIIGSTATSASFIASVLIQLSQNPEVATKYQNLLNEENSLCEGQAAIKYFDDIVSETERLNSPSGALTSIRTTGRDFFVDENYDKSVSSPTKLIVPKGSLIIVSKDVDASSADIFADPNSFKPERWGATTIEMTKTKNLSMYSLGSRSCPGRSLAYDSQLSTIPRIMNNFSIELVEKGDFVHNGLYSRFVGCKVALKPLFK